VDVDAFNNAYAEPIEAIEVTKNITYAADTCVIVWDALKSVQLSTKAKKAIKKVDEENELLMCDISIWEISMLVKRKRIDVDETPANLVRLILR
jgi:PIN domain nuclease of toxin-antitoxin system